MIMLPPTIPERVARALDAAGSTMLDEVDWAELAFACLDQAGVRVSERELERFREAADRRRFRREERQARLDEAWL